MKRLLRADIYRVMKSRLTLVALILCLAFPVLIVLMYVGIRAVSGLAGDAGAELDMLYNANSIIASAYSLTNNIGLVIPAFAGILVCSDYSNGTLRNKVIAGNCRADIYLSHLVVSILFSVVLITVYAVMTTGLALIFFPFKTAPGTDLGWEILCFVVNGTLSFAFMATLSTMLALTLRSIAPTLIFTIVFAMLLLMVTSVVSLMDYEKFRHLVYFIPTFTGSFFNLGSSLSLTMILNGGVTGDSEKLMFAEGVLSYLFFGGLHTVIGLTVFGKRDIK